jgi:transcriptional regulator with XRE-family HTH domain
MEKEVFLKKLGDRIRTIRNANGLSQGQLAIAIGKDQQSIQRLEAGKINPSLYYLQEIAIGLKTPVSNLVEGL